MGAVQSIHDYEGIIIESFGNTKFHINHDGSVDFELTVMKEGYEQIPLRESWGPCKMKYTVEELEKKYSIIWLAEPRVD